MSTPGSPGGPQKFSRPTPPQRGSFPLDHDAECAAVMKNYLKCLRAHRGVNDDECRELSQGYLQCRMEKGLMAREEVGRLGFADLQRKKEGG